MNFSNYEIIKPIAKDVDQIWKLVNHYAETSQELLPRSKNHILEHLLSFWIAKNSNNKVLGCVSLHIWTDALSEIKSLAVYSSQQGKGIGKQLVEKCIIDAKNLCQKEIFALTFRPEFFYRLGFEKTNKDNLPHKIWNECIHCPKLLTCGEIPVLMQI